jgi:hypothetical protein
MTLPVTMEPQEVSVREWILQALPELGAGEFGRVALASQQITKLTKPYATFRIIQSTEEAHAGLFMTDTAGDVFGFKQKIVHSWQGTVSLDIYGDTARSLRRKLTKSIHLEAVKLENRTRGILIAREMLNSDTWVNLGHDWEERSRADYQIRFKEIVFEDVDTIESVDITINVT